MSWGAYLIIFFFCVGGIILFRTAPMMLLAGKELNEDVRRMLDFIPVAAFAALVANDLFNPSAFSAGLWPALLPYVASIPVIITAVKTKSLALCIIVGVSVYAALYYFC